MKHIILAIFLAACSVQVQPQATEEAQSTRVAETVATLMPQESAPQILPTLTEVVEDQWSFLLLGIDKAYWRDSDPKRPHTDFMMVVSIRAAKVSLIQIPRNIYIPVSNIPDDFAFGFYSRGGLGMLEGWVEQALGIQLVGSALMRMDDFIEMVDSLGGLTIGGDHMDGFEVLQYTRFGLWDRPGYDSGGRHFLVASALADAMRMRLTDPESAFGLAIHYLPLVETDLDPGPMVDFLFSEGLPLIQGRYSVESVRLEDALCTQNLPFEMSNVTRGLMICPGIDLQEWVLEALQ